MPYVKRTTKAGKTIEIEYYYTSRYNKKGIKKRKKVKPTRPEQDRINTKQAERNLRLLINNNFGYGDFHVVLDYIRVKGMPDRSKEQMRKDLNIFLREIRKEYKKSGKNLKYISVMEIGKKGARHHHLVINQIDTKILQKAWYKAYEGHNRIKVFPLDDSGNYRELASYLIKYTSLHRDDKDEKALQKKRYCCSRNLIRPIPEYKLVTKRSWYRCEPKTIKGYYVDKSSVDIGITSPEYYGYGFFRYTMVKLIS